MQQDDQYHGTGMSRGQYTYQTHDEQPQHAVCHEPTYYEVGHQTGLEFPLPQRYPESSQRSMMQTPQYGAVYGPPSALHEEDYHLSDQLPTSDGSFSTSIHGVSHSYASAREPPSFLAQTDTDTLRSADVNLYETLTSHIGNMPHTYMPDISLTAHTHQRHNVPHDYKRFAHATMPDDAYTQVSIPSASSTAGRVAANVPAHQLKRRQFTDDFTPQFTSFPCDAPGSEADKPDMSTNLGYREGPSYHPDTSLDTSSALPPDDPVPPPVTVSKKKKSKMHDCEICGKKFPRPSGLRTHMNTHNNVKPYPCSYPGCPRSFAVRSNAKRHLRTHGVTQTPAPPSSSPASSSAPPYVVGFSPPTVAPPPDGAESHQMRRAPLTLKWMPHSLSARTNAGKLRSISEAEESDVEEEDDDYEELCMREGSIGFHSERGEELSKKDPDRSGRLALSIPLRAVVPTSLLPHSPSRCAPYLSISLCGANSKCCARYEERNSFREAGSHPYHPSQFSILPGPAISRPSLMV